MKKVSLGLLLAVAVTMLVAPITPALAGTADAPYKLPNKTILGEGENAKLGGFVTFLGTITDWLFTFLLIFAVVMFIYAAYLYLFSGGAEESTAKAKNYLVYGVIGVAVGMLAKGIVFVVAQLVGVTLAQ